MIGFRNSLQFLTKMQISCQIANVLMCKCANLGERGKGKGERLDKMVPDVQIKKRKKRKNQLFLIILPNFLNLTLKLK